jgi:4-hydroxybenzoyl-CoA reductase subunit beta
MIDAKQPIYLSPETVENAFKLSNQYEENFSYVAGGTDLWVNRYQGNNKSNCLIDITQISELQTVTSKEEMLKIGALVKLDQLKNIPEIRDNFPVLIEAAHSVGSPVIRKMGTLGGNILCENRCIFYNQSDIWREAVDYCLKSGGDICIATGGTKVCFSEFVSDTAPALISLDAQVEIFHQNGSEIFKLEEIYSGDAIKPRNLSKTAIIKFILLPLNQEYRVVFKKLRPRNSMDFTSLTTAVSINNNERLKIALGGVSPKPVVIESDINENKDVLIKEALKLSKTVDNDAYSRLYRKKMIQIFLRQSFEKLFISKINKKNFTG